ncbi:MAG: S9 family peptidase [Planctomycetes bacterium]|nr:S9 family peptidase [Planctomycetota bacterium]
MKSRRRFTVCPMLVAIFGGSAMCLAEDEPTFLSVPPGGTIQFTAASAEHDVPQRFRLKPHSFDFTATFRRTSGPVRIYDVRFPSPVETAIPQNNTVHAQYFQPAGNGPFPGVVVLHILGGEFPLSQAIANALARRGVAALFVKMPYYGERRSAQSPRRMISRDPDETLEGMTQAVLDVRRAAAWLADRPEVDAERLGVTGISLGGIMSALSAAGEPRFRKVAIYLGGGRLPEALWNMERPEVADFRTGWLATGGTKESFLEKLRPIDPVTYARLLRGRDVLMVAARHDEIIPPECTLALWEALDRRPELVWLDCGHISAALYIIGETDRLCRFFSGGWPD